MYRNENMRKIVKIFIVSFLCSETQTNFLLHGSKNSALSYAYAAELSVNATHATPESSYFHASIRLIELDDNFGDGHICSGALIAPSVVLTAAKCVFNDANNRRRHPAELSVVLGTQNRYQRLQHTRNYGVTHLYTPETFNALTLRDNIAILMLERDIFESEFIKPINLNLQDIEDLFERDFKVTSWLKTHEGASVQSLMLLNATRVHHIYCHQNNQLICLNYFEQSQQQQLCNAVDIGAPLVFNEKLLGLNAFGNYCSLKSQPAIFSDIRRHHEWILEKIGNGNNQNSSIWGTLAFLIFTAFVVKTVNFKKRRTFDLL